MSIILALVAKFPDNVLTEYTDFDGNFLQVTRSFLQKAIKENKRYTVKYDKYKYQYISENSLVFLCLSENVSDSVAFAFLKDVQKQLFNKYEYEELIATKAYQLREFDESLSELIVS